MHAPTLDALLHQELPAARRGDTAAYGRIVTGCQNTVTAIALAITRDVAASEDIAQDAFLRAWQQLDRLKNHDSFLPWLRQITRNLARDHLRARRHGAMTGQDAELAIAIAADPAPEPGERLLITEQETVATEIIAALPEDSRETLLLYYREGQSSQQVAALLGLSDAAVRKRLSRARETVRGELLARFGEFARGTAPSAGFALVVTSALTLASPPATAAALVGLGGAAAGKSALQVLVGALGSAGFGMAGAAAGIWWGLRRNLRGALDARERAELKRSAAINACASLAFVLVVSLCAVLHIGWVPLVALTAVFFGVIFWQSAVVEPRIKARRHAHEALQDPAGAARQRKRERRLCWLGIIVGLGCGGGGLAYAVIRTGLPAF
ncbi:RNA polymerase sigma factor, sigma-70 family [Pseudoxanthomonas sp. GM95]|uniref:RNA polymerase sigma factor n=1 Tax=Pseudoxanthomonas sp. GM95 TaxID=1881043 RepID=UPI0008C7F1D2|nr:RNA polymerase sigma factor, sigma-70 family [Pseudoxanthomonas sp. GM95]